MLMILFRGDNYARTLLDPSGCFLKMDRGRIYFGGTYLFCEEISFYLGVQPYMSVAINIQDRFSTTSAASSPGLFTPCLWSFMGYFLTQDILGFSPYHRCFSPGISSG